MVFIFALLHIIYVKYKIQNTYLLYSINYDILLVRIYHSYKKIYKEVWLCKFFLLHISEHP